MYPSVMIEEMAHERAAELRRSAERTRGARAVALAARQRDVVARRRVWGLLPDRPIVTARPIRRRVAVQEPAPALTALPDAAKDTAAAAADAGAPVAVLTPCRAC